MRIDQLEAKEQPSEVVAHLQLVSQIGSGRFETQHRHKSGHLFNVDISATYDIASSSLKCNFVISRLSGRDVRASLPLDRQVKVARNDLHTSHPRRTLPDRHPCQSQS
jgi:hypothetical protein